MAANKFLKMVRIVANLYNYEYYENTNDDTTELPFDFHDTYSMAAF